MTNKPCVALFILSCLGTCATVVFSQEAASRQSLGISSTFAPDSSHILIGTAERRRTWTAGIEYDRRIWGNGVLRLDYSGSITPLFQERDPTLVATYADIAGSRLILPSSGQRVIYVNNNLSGPPEDSAARRLSIRSTAQQRHTPLPLPRSERGSMHSPAAGSSQPSPRTSAWCSPRATSP